MSAVPKRKPDDRDSDERELDNVLAKIEKLAEYTEKKAETEKLRRGSTPKGGMSRDQLKKTQEQFHAMTTEEFTLESREDWSDELEASAAPEPEPVPQKDTKKTRWF